MIIATLVKRVGQTIPLRGLSGLHRRNDRRHKTIVCPTLARTVVLMLAVSLLFAQQPAPAPAPQQPAAQAPPTQPATPPQVSAADLSLNNVALTEVIDRLARQLKITYTMDRGLSAGGSVYLNSYGEGRTLDARNLLDMVLRINGLAMVDEGGSYRLVKAADAFKQPIPFQVNAKDFPQDDALMLNLIFLKYMTVDELAKILDKFTGESAQIVSYPPANLLFILDNRRSMARTMDLIKLFDSDTFASERVRLYELKNARPTDLQKDLEKVLQSISLDGKSSPVRFLAVDRISTLIAVAPNQGVFDTIETWIEKLDVPATVARGAVDTYVYPVRYGRADCIAQALTQLFSPQGLYGGGYGYGAGLAPYGGGGGYGNYGYGAGGSGSYGGTYGGQVGGGGYGGGYGGGGGGGGYGGGGTYGAPNAFSNNFGGAGGCSQGGQGGAFGGGGGYGGVPYGAPAFGGYAAQTPLTGGPVGASGSAGQAAGAAGAGGGSQTPQEIPPRIVPLPLDNKLMIQADPQHYQSILKMLKELDVPPRQILLESKIYSIDLVDQFSSGVNAYFQKISGTDRTPAASLVSGVVNFTGGMLASQGRELLLALSLNENTTHAHVISEPSLIATDSIPASINVGTQVPVLTSQVGTPLQSGGTNAFQQNISGVNTGVTLEVNARINPSGVVTLFIGQQVSGQSQSNASGNALTPSFDQQVVQTQIMMQDGDTVAVGGVIKETTSSGVNGIPLLSRIPYLGGLFGTKTYNHERTELIIFMTPHVIYDTTDLLEASDELKMRIKKLKKYVKD